MNKVIVDSTFWEVFAEATIEVLTVEGIDNHVQEDQEAVSYTHLGAAFDTLQNLLKEQ